MNKANKNMAQARSLMYYLNSDRKHLVRNAGRNRFVKRVITRLVRRANRALCAEENN